MRLFLVLFLGVLTISVRAQSLPPGITPEMIKQVQSLPLAQQKSLAKQYGITLPSASGSTFGEPSLALPGEPLEPESNELALKVRPTFEDPIKERIRYGRNLFNRDVSTFAPTDAAPVPESYRLGIGDQLVVQLFGKENDQLNLQIGRDGTVSFDRLGVFPLSGLTYEDARDLIRTRVQQQLIGVEAVVTMGRLRAISVFMAGEVSVPGAYSVSALTTITQALFQAGGVTDIGSLRNIQVRRAGETVAIFDVYDLLMRGDASNDVRLQSGDVVFVPPYVAIAEIKGEVKRPMLYELVEGESLKDLVSMGGGYTEKAFPSLTVLTRTPDNGGLAAAISLNLLDKPTSAIPLVNGDVLRVPSAGEGLSNTVTLTGAVNRPGDYGWFQGMRLSHLLRDAKTDLLREADLSYSLIISYKNSLLDIEVRQFSLIDAISNPMTQSDPILNEFDEVLVFSLPELEELAETLNETGDGQRFVSEGMVSGGENDLDAGGVDDDFSRQTLLAPVIAKLRTQARAGQPVQTVSVSGAVYSPGTYPLFDNTSVSDLVLAAGGLKDSAFAKSAELRSIRELGDGRMGTTYKEVDLDQAFSGGYNPILSTRDHLTVRDIPDWSPNDKIEIYGEVKFPGTYLIQVGETLADVVERAGGLTPEAFPEASVFTRVEVARREVERSKAFAADIRQSYASRLLTEETTSNTMVEVAQITEALEQFEGKGRILIDLPLALVGDMTANIKVSDGDKLIIPRRVNTVTVVGEVYQQGTHTFENGKRLQDYLSLSAGLTARADDKSIYIIKANGSVAVVERSWWRFGGATQKLSPGDTIVVPINAQYKESLASWREITQIVYQSIISVAAVANL